MEEKEKFDRNGKKGSNDNVFLSLRVTVTG